MRRSLVLSIVSTAALGAGAVGLSLARAAGPSAAPGPHACVPADPTTQSGPGHYRFITSACEDVNSRVATLPLHRGTSHGQTVWFVITDDSDQADAAARGVNYVPKLANARDTAAVQKVTLTKDVVGFPATVDFDHTRVLVPGPNGFPPAQAEPPSVGEPGYSPLIQLPDGTILNAPHVANASGHAAKVVDLDEHGGKNGPTVQYLETEGRYEDKHIHYASFDGSNPVAATIENVTYAPALANVPAQGDEGLTTSAREELDAFVNGPVGANNPQRQGINSAILDHLDPHNMLHETPVLPNHADIGDLHYAPMWDVHFAEWTPAAIAAGDRVELRSVDEVHDRVAAGLVTGFGGSTFGAVGIVVDCPLISIDVA